MSKRKIPDVVSIRQYAKELGISEATVRLAIRSGKITRGVQKSEKDGKPQIIRSIATEEWKESYSGRTNASEVLKEKFFGDVVDTPTVETKTEQASSVPPIPTSQETQLVESPTTMREAQLKEQIFKANMAEVKYNVALGKLVNKDDVYKTFFEFGTQVRESIQSIPDRVVDLIMACSSRNEAHEILSVELSKALENLSNFKYEPSKTEEDQP
jgi:hypothetical protein